MPSRHRAVLAPVIALAAGLGLAPAASAAEVASQVPCVRYLPGVKSFPVAATGFPAGASLNFLADGQSVGSGLADAAGNFNNAADPFFPPSLPFGKNLKTYQLTADDGQGTVTAPVPVRVSRITVVAPSTSKPRKKVRFRLYGFKAATRAYLHVRRNGKSKGRFSLGRTKGPCGTLTKRMRFMPVRNYRTGTYRYYFSHTKKFKKSEAIYQARVRIYRTFKSSSASAAQATAAGAWG